MTDPYDRPRIYINWERVRPVGWRGWLAAIGFTALAIAMFALVAFIASTLFAIGLIAAVIAAVALFIVNLFRSRKRDVGPYRGNYDA
jgi:Na+/melibiose symporter-like transporter